MGLFQRSLQSHGQVAKLLEARLRSPILSLDGPQRIAGRAIWSVETPEGRKFILIDGPEIRIFHGDSAFEQVVLAAARLRSIYAVESAIALAGMVAALAGMAYGAFRMLTAGWGGVEVGEIALVFGAAGLLSTTAGMWLRFRSSELQLLLATGERLTVDREGLREAEIRALSEGESAQKAYRGPGGG